MPLAKPFLMQLVRRVGAIIGVCALILGVVSQLAAPAPQPANAERRQATQLTTATRSTTKAPVKPATLVAQQQAQPVPRPSHCADYNNMEAGKGHPENQAWFNHLDARGYARLRMACVYGWGTVEWNCLNQMITEESNWNHLADGPNGPAGNTWGIPQAYPGHKMATHGQDWQTNPRVQVRWMLDYIRGRYGTPLRTPNPCHAGY